MARGEDKEENDFEGYRERIEMDRLQFVAWDEGLQKQHKAIKGERWWCVT